jgi:cytochrome c oxidase subunit II
MIKKWTLLMAASVLMVIVLSACGSNTKQAATGKVVEIKVTAKNFEFDKKEIHVKKGDKVKIILENKEGGHGLSLPKYDVNIQGSGSAEFTADKTGTYEYFCSVMCGSGHGDMTGKLIVE